MGEWVELEASAEPVGLVESGEPEMWVGLVESEEPEMWVV